MNTARRTVELLGERELWLVRWETVVKHWSRWRATTVRCQLTTENCNCCTTVVILKALQTDHF
jgi:hypothetical protein